MHHCRFFAKRAVHVSSEPETQWWFPILELSVVVPLGLEWGILFASFLVMNVGPSHPQIHSASLPSFTQLNTSIEWHDFGFGAISFPRKHQRALQGDSEIVHGPVHTATRAQLKRHEPIVLDISHATRRSVWNNKTPAKLMQASNLRLVYPDLQLLLSRHVSSCKIFRTEFASSHWNHPPPSTPPSSLFVTPGHPILDCFRQLFAASYRPIGTFTPVTMCTVDLILRLPEKAKWFLSDTNPSNNNTTMSNPDDNNKSEHSNSGTGVVDCVA